MRSRKTYYSIGFDENEKKEIEAGFAEWGKQHDIAFFKKLTNYIKFLALTCIDLQQENKRLKAILANASQSNRTPESQASNGNEKELVDAWTGYFRGAKKNGNVIYPEWN